MFLCEKYRNLNEVLMLQTLSYSLTTSNLQPFLREEMFKAEGGTPRQVEVIRRGAESEMSYRYLQSAPFKQMDQTVIVAPGFRFQPLGIIGIGRHLPVK